MIQSVLLYGLAVPVGLTIFWWSCRSCWPDRRLPPGLLLPSLTLIVAYAGIIGAPGLPTDQALSGLVYTVVLLIVYALLIHSVPSPTPAFVFPARLTLLLVVLGLFYYPRYTVTDNPIREGLYGFGIVVIGLLAWWIMDNQIDIQVNTRLFGGGTYLIVVGLFFGVYASFIQGQLILGTGVSIVSIYAIQSLGKPSNQSDGDPLFVVGFSVAILVYGMSFTTVNPVTVLLLGSGLLAPVVTRIPWARGSALRSCLILALTIFLAAGLAAGYETYGTELFEDEEAYRPYRR